MGLGYQPCSNSGDHPVTCSILFRKSLPFPTMHQTNRLFISKVRKLSTSRQMVIVRCGHGYGSSPVLIILYANPNTGYLRGIPHGYSKRRFSWIVPPFLLDCGSVNGGFLTGHIFGFLWCDHSVCSHYPVAQLLGCHIYIRPPNRVSLWMGSSNRIPPCFRLSENLSETKKRCKNQVQFRVHLKQKPWNNWKISSICDQCCATTAGVVFKFDQGTPPKIHFHFFGAPKKIMEPKQIQVDCYNKTFLVQQISAND